MSHHKTLNQTRVFTVLHRSYPLVTHLHYISLFLKIGIRLEVDVRGSEFTRNVERQKIEAPLCFVRRV